MATKSSIHVKPCNVASSEAHNRRTAEYMRNIGKSKIYIVPELTADNEQWINPDFGSPELQAHYENIKRMVKEKTDRAMQEKERERKGKNGKIIKVHHTTANFPAQGRGALAERSACTGGQGEFPSRRKMVQAQLPCPYRIRLDEPRYRQEPQTQ